MTNKPVSASTKGIRITVALLVLFIACMVGLIVNKQLNMPKMTVEQLREKGVFVYPNPRIIKPFELLDHKGQPFNNERLQGHWTLVFFGFTHCPDICPATMAILNQTLAAMDDQAFKDSTEVVLLSVDPARDTVEKLAEYVPFFNPEFTGVTGEFLSVLKLANNLNAPFQKVVEPDGSYTVDHASYIFIINDKGDYMGFMKPPFEPQKLAYYYQALREIR